MHPIKPPIAQSDAIHDASSVVILPVGNGDQSEVRIKILGLVQPTPIPQTKPNKLTEVNKETEKKTNNKG